MKHNPIRAAALVVVALFGMFILWMDWRASNVLSSPDWCSKALQADRITPDSSFDGLTGCVGIMTIQLKAIAIDSHIRVLVEAFALLVLVVIVIAGGRLSFTASKTGVGANMGAADTPVEEAANKVASAAVVAAAEVHTDAAKVGEPPNPNYKGPAMPPPPAKGS